MPSDTTQSHSIPIALVAGQIVASSGLQSISSANLKNKYDAEPHPGMSTRHNLATIHPETPPIITADEVQRITDIVRLTIAQIRPLAVSICIPTPTIQQNDVCYTLYLFDY